MERRSLAGDVRALVALRLERRGVLAAFTERGGGVSDPPFHSLNLGFRTGDDLDRVRRNRHRMVEALGIPPFSTARHVHETELVRVSKAEAGVGFEEPGTSLGEADVLATDQPGLPVAVLVADCLPIVLVADDLLVLVHAGWRGLAAGILAVALSAVDDPSAASAAIGPSIGPCHYEVGTEVVEAVDRGSLGGAVVERRDGRTALDLAATASRALAASGVGDIEVMGGCTACQPERFYSHRRDGRTGRHLMVAMRQ